MSKENRPEKNSFLLHKDQWEPISDLDNEDLGLLMRAIYNYQLNDVEPEKSNPIYPYFKFFKARFTFEETKYKEKSDGNAERGRLGGIASAESKRLKKEANQANATISSELKQTQANQADKDKDKDKGSVNEKEPVSDEPKIFARLTRLKTIQMSELHVRYPHVDSEVIGREWELWLLDKHPEKAKSQDIKELWNSFNAYMNKANQFAYEKIIARSKGIVKPQGTAPEKMPPLNSAFD